MSRELSALSRAGLLHRTRAAFVLDDPEALRAEADMGLGQSGKDARAAAPPVKAGRRQPK